MQLIDIGANLTHESFDHDRNAVLQRAREAGVVQQVVTGASREHSPMALRLAQAHPGELFATAGVHPHHATEYTDECDAEMRALHAHPEVVAVGECGLDYHRDLSPREVQRKVFIAQLELAIRLEKPVFLHQRSAHDDFHAIVREYRAALPDDRVFIHGSRDELIQLFENLVENAIKYGGDGGRVEIIATPAELGGMPATSIEVRDHGPGIESEHIPRLTERFYRVDVETSRGKQGTGLGLAIVKHIVTRHEGRLTIRSRPGEGTRVYVIFPAMVADNVDQNPEKEEKTET